MPVPIFKTGGRNMCGESSTVIIIDEEGYVTDTLGTRAQSPHQSDDAVPSGVISSKQLTHLLVGNNKLLHKMAAVHEAHSRQFDQLKKYVDEVGQSNRNEVERLRSEVNHFRATCNIRMEKIESIAKKSNTRKGAGGGSTREREVSVGNDDVVPSLDGPYQNVQPDEVLENNPGTSGAGRGVPDKQDNHEPCIKKRKTYDGGKKIRGAKAKEPCPFCGSVLMKTYLWKHKKYHCSAAREYNELTEGEEY